MPSRVSFMLRALSYPNDRLFFGGQIVSLIGSWISMTATSWLVYRLTGSAMLLGVVGFAGQFPGFVMGPFAGAFLGAGRERPLDFAELALEVVAADAGGRHASLRRPGRTPSTMNTTPTMSTTRPVTR